MDNYKDGHNSILNCQSIIVNFHFCRSIEHFKCYVNFILFFVYVIESEVHFHSDYVYEFVHDEHVIIYYTISPNDFRNDSLTLITHNQYLVFTFRYDNEIQIQREWVILCATVVRIDHLQVVFVFNKTFHDCLSINQFTVVYKHV